MPTKREHVVSPAERPERSLNWEDIRMFLVVARLGSVRAASAEAGMSVNATRRRIEALEREIQSVLFIRSVRGMVLTEEGKKVLVAGEAMKQQAHLLARLGSREKTGRRSTVNVGVTEGLGTSWVVPRILKLLTANPTIQVNLKCETLAPNISAFDVDLAIQLDRPRSPDVIVTRLGWLHTCLFASRRYVEAFGVPQSRVELIDHALIDVVVVSLMVV